MRELLFNVKQQVLQKNESCDFTNITKGTNGYLKAKFFFDNEWDDCKKIVAFITKDKDEYAFVVENDECMIPKEVSNETVFYICMTGVCKDYKITTNKVSVYQR